MVPVFCGLNNGCANVVTNMPVLYHNNEECIYMVRAQCQFTLSINTSIGLKAPFIYSTSYDYTLNSPTYIAPYIRAGPIASTTTSLIFLQATLTNHSPRIYSIISTMPAIYTTISVPHATTQAVVYATQTATAFTSASAPDFETEPTQVKIHQNIAIGVGAVTGGLVVLCFGWFLIYRKCILARRGTLTFEK